MNDAEILKFIVDNYLIVDSTYENSILIANRGVRDMQMFDVVDGDRFSTLRRAIESIKSAMEEKGGAMIEKNKGKL